MRFKGMLLGILILVGQIGAWEVGGTPLIVQSGDQIEPKVLATSSGDFYIVYHDQNRPWHCFAMRFDKNGNPLWSSPVQLCESEAYQRRHQAVVTPSGKLIVALEDNRAGPDRIYLSKIGPDGSYEWNSEGIAPSLTDFDQNWPCLCVDPSDGTWVCWMDYRSGEADVYLAKIRPEGEKEFETAVCSLPGGQGNPVLVPSGEGCLIFWGDSRDSLPGVYGQRITKNSPSGQWGPDGKLIIPFHPFENLSLMEENPYFFPYALSDGQGGTILYNPFYGTEIWQRVDSLGNLLWVPPPDMINPYQAVSNGASGAIGGIGNDRGPWDPHSVVIVIQIDSSGNAIWGGGIEVWESPVEDTSQFRTYPSLTDDSHQGAVLTWVQSDYTGNNLLITRVDSSGKVIWSPPTIICNLPYEKAHPFVIKGPNKGYIVVYEENHPNTGWDIMANYVDSTGQKGIEERDGRWRILDNRILSVTPNPFDRWAVIKFQLSMEAEVSLRVYDISGRVVRTLTKAQSLEPGIHTLNWDGRDDKGQLLSSGVYFIRFKAEDYSKTQKVILFR